MRVNIGKDIEMDVNTSLFNSEVMDHVVYIGLRNILMDSHAAITKATDGDNYIAASEAKAQTKLQAMYDGEVRVAGTRSTDPIATQMRALAVAHARKQLRASGLKARDIKSEDVTAIANGILERNRDALRKVAERMVKAAAALEVDVI